MTSLLARDLHRPLNRFAQECRYVVGKSRARRLLLRLLLARALGAGLGLRRLPVAALVAVLVPLLSALTILTWALVLLALVAPVVTARGFLLALLVPRLVAALAVRALVVRVRLNILAAWLRPLLVAV